MEAITNALVSRAPPLHPGIDRIAIIFMSSKIMMFVIKEDLQVFFSFNLLVFVI